MVKAVKFTFDTQFSLSRNAQAKPRKSYSAEEIEEIKRAAREEGRKDGDVRATQAVAASIGQLASAVLAAIEAMDAELETIRAEAAAFAFAAAKRLADAALAACPDAEIIEAFEAAVHQAIGEPRLVVTTAPGIAERVAERIEAIAREKGFEGRIQFASETGLAPADCRMEWRGGGVERAQDAIEAALAARIARRFPNTSNEGRDK